MALGTGEILGGGFHELGNLGKIPILFTGLSPTPTAGDDAGVMANLEARFGVGNVEYIRGAGTVDSDIDGRLLAVVSSTISSSTIRGKWDDKPVPILNWEEALYKTASGDFCLSASSGVPDIDTINVTAPWHPIAVKAGLAAGNVLISTSSSSRSCPLGTIPAGVVQIAADPSDPTCHMLAVGEAGEADQCGGTFAARRSSFFLRDANFNELNAAGLDLWDATIDWLLDLLPDPDFLLQEDGFFLLQENGDKIAI